LLQGYHTQQLFYLKQKSRIVSSKLLKYYTSHTNGLRLFTAPLLKCHPPDLEGLPHHQALHNFASLPLEYVPQQYWTGQWHLSHRVLWFAKSVSHLFKVSVSIPKVASLSSVAGSTPPSTALLSPTTGISLWPVRDLYSLSEIPSPAGASLDIMK
jgi:hypothetical protein